MCRGVEIIAVIYIFMFHVYSQNAAQINHMNVLSLFQGFLQREKSMILPISVAQPSTKDTVRLVGGSRF